jgi:hypothetical protein
MRRSECGSWRRHRLRDSRRSCSSLAPSARARGISDAGLRVQGSLVQRYYRPLRGPARRRGFLLAYRPAFRRRQAYLVPRSRCEQGAGEVSVYAAQTSYSSFFESSDLAMILLIASPRAFAASGELAARRTFTL